MDEGNNNRIFMEELIHLNYVQKIIQEQIADMDEYLATSRQDIIEQKRYLWENLYELDPEEIASNRVNISDKHDSYEFNEGNKRVLLKLQDNTYFGRVDFVFDGESETEIIYIGLGGLRSKSGVKPIIFDWRAPISSMYYDFDLGQAYYEAPRGKMSGDIIQKRQLKIQKGKLEYALNSDFNVDDEILQKELSNNSSTKMKNIVATIQREQNLIVRDQKTNIMLVQGVAGSGKTSIALHRIAFLLYQNRNNLCSSDILIISPNTIFADYISNVLPELGEQNIAEVSFDEIAQYELKGICHFESKYDQINYLVESKSEDDNRLKRIKFKNSFIYLEEIKNFIREIEKTLMRFNSYKINDIIFEKEMIESIYKSIKVGTVFERVNKVAERIADIYESEKNTVISIYERKKIKQSLREMADTTDIVLLYSSFVEQLGKKYCVMEEDYITQSKINYEDVFPILLFKYMLNGKDNSLYDRIKHIIVDEMQDYTIIQYEILHILFNCKMTILGDINQVIVKSNNSILENIKKVFGEKVTLIKLLKSYRSTFEISEFCRKLCNLSQAESFERHGEKPSIEECSCYDDMITKIQNKIDKVDLNQINTVVIICKSEREANKLYDALDDKHKEKIYLMNKEEANFLEGIIVTNSYLVKGLEFDYVIIPNVTDEEYQTDRERQILYISSTRALHKLDIMYYGKKSNFLNDAQK